MPLHRSQPCSGKGACVTQWSYDPCHARPPKIDSGEFWQNKITRRENGKSLQYSVYPNSPKFMIFLVVMYGCESWIIKKAECQKIDDHIVVLEKTLKSPLDFKKMKPVNPKGNQCWIFIGRTDAETPILWPPDAENRFIGKYPDAGKDWRQKEKRMAEDEMVK